MKINDIVNVIIEFRLEDESSFVGICMLEKNNIFLNGKVSEEQYKLLQDDSEIRGSFGQYKITILNYYIKETRYSYDENYYEVIIFPDEVIIGKKYFENTIVKKVEMDIEKLNYFSVELPLAINPNFSKNNPSVVNFKYPNSVKYDNDEYHFELCYSFSHNISRAGIWLENIPIIELEFKGSIEIEETIKKLAMIRMLFTFLADYYIPFGKINFYDDENERYLYYMNYIDEIDVGFNFFIINFQMIHSYFNDILEKWSAFYQRNTCIAELFYEIISNRSIGINQFLNLTQAIEVYSTRYRNLEVKSVYENFKKKDHESNKKCALFHRIYDILSLFNYIFNFSIEEIEKIAKLISNIRNYYTHYNKNKAVCIEYKDIYTLSRYMRLILLSIVYREIGIGEDIICKAMNTGKYREIKTNIIKIIK